MRWWGAGVVIGLERGADLHMAQLMPLPLTVSCFSKIQIGFIILVSADPGSPGKGPLNGCMYVCMYVYFMWVSCQRHWRAGPAECSIYWGEIWCLRVRCNAGRSVKVSYWSSSSTAQTQRTAAQRCVQSPTVPATARQQGARLIFYPPTTVRCTNLTDTNVFKRHLKFYFFNHYFYM